MDKQQLIALVKQKIEDGTISQNEIVSIFGNGETPTQVRNIQSPIISNSNTIYPTEKTSAGEKIMHALYLIGAIILISGIVILLVQNWEEIGFIGRIASTLGIAFMTYIIGCFMAKGEHETLSQVSITISSVLMPIGFFIFLDEFGYEMNLNVFLISSLILSLFFGISQYFIRNRILVLITVLYSTALYFSLIYKIIEDGTYTDMTNILKIAVIILGVAYYVIAYGYNDLILSKGKILNGEENAVSGVLYTLGSLAVLIPIVTFDGFFDFVSLIVIIGVAYLGFFVKSKIVFLIASAFLVLQIILITWEYFADSFGWPFMLMLIGGLIIATAFVSIKISKTINSGK